VQKSEKNAINLSLRCEWINTIDTTVYEYLALLGMMR